MNAIRRGTTPHPRNAKIKERQDQERETRDPRGAEQTRPANALNAAHTPRPHVDAHRGPSKGENARRSVRGAQPFAVFTAAVSLGTISNRSPTTPSCATS